jgi:transposase
MFMKEHQVFATLLGLTRPWSVERVDIVPATPRVDIWLVHESRIRFACPTCGQHCAVYDHAPERVFRHLDTCGYQTFLHVRLPRVQCAKHGIQVILSDFGENRSGMTYAFESQVIAFAHECSVEAVGRLCHLSWTSSWRTIERAVARGQARKKKRVPRWLGVDEKSLTRGHRYETVVYDLAKSTVEYVGDKRQQSSLETYYQQFKPHQLARVQAVAMDMWDPYIAATRAYIPAADKKIVFDRFHVMKHVLTAVDTVRKQEAKALKEQGAELLKGTKYWWLWSYENLPEKYQTDFEALRTLDLKVCRAWTLKEHLRHLWEYRYEKWMRRFFAHWYGWACRSRLAPMIKAAATVKRHLDNIVTYARHRITNALGESLNAKIEKAKRLACGFRNREHYKTAIYFHCGGLNLYPYPPSKKSIQWSFA